MISIYGNFKFATPEMRERAKGGKKTQRIKVWDQEKIWYLNIFLELRIQRFLAPNVKKLIMGVTKLGLLTILVMGMFCIRATARY